MPSCHRDALSGCNLFPTLSPWSQLRSVYVQSYAEQVNPQMGDLNDAMEVALESTSMVPLQIPPQLRTAFNEFIAAQVKVLPFPVHFS